MCYLKDMMYFKMCFCFIVNFIFFEYKIVKKYIYGSECNIYYDKILFNLIFLKL